MKKQVLLMAKSKKYYGYCVAGIDVETGEWIRPMYPGEESVPQREFLYMIGDNRNEEPSLLELMDVEFTNVRATEHHPEDMEYDPQSLGQIDRNATYEIYRRLEKDKEHEYIYHDDQRVLTPEFLDSLEPDQRYSLMIVEPENVSISRDTKKEGKGYKYFADFLWKDVKYNRFNITDIEYIGKLDREYNDRFDAEGRLSIDNVLFVISLGLPFEKMDPIVCYKLIATVIDKNTVNGSQDWNREESTVTSLRNRGKRWSAEEDESLKLEFLDEKCTIEEIARRHGRSELAIRFRLFGHGLIDEDPSVTVE